MAAGDGGFECGLGHFLVTKHWQKAFVEKGFYLSQGLFLFEGLSLSEGLAILIVHSRTLL